MGRCDSKQPTLWASCSAEVLLHDLLQRSDFFRISGPRMDRLAHRALHKGKMAGFLELRVSLVFKESRFAQAVDQMPCGVSNLTTRYQTRQLRMQIQIGPHAIEVLEAVDQERRDDQRGIGVLEGVANQ